ncbi:aminoacyl-histidine dipeptidase [Nonlabens sp. Ci31]|jgi:dipeptidase D|uniref:aminoacyl-histidine dipeptidase n=1 Tax=Nonlabens sp. Ci31 TaxID=2608253 RepID=UPI00146355A5|nr:aminoacyl-histidine dipeptidase [Nonlabens sp. Ci31]QJP35071.1 aminoacyl-histidine dipeptidase [Nonlabens sp. Ci31]
MSKEVREQEPQLLWNHFADLNAVPRPSKKEERVRAFMVAFGKSLDLEVIEDAIGNVIIRKPATSGMEDRESIIMQSHLDMVHQKNNDTDFDFLTQGIDMFVKGDIIKARGTTLGADNGIGVAAIMAVLSSKDIAHPAIEALFTIDEETGMTGAKELDKTILTSKILLNLDTEEDDEIDIGCAGGVDVTATKSYALDTVSNEYVSKKITVKGLNGGHSGMDIIKGLGNANKMITRLVDSMQKKGAVHFQSLNGGSLRNAIPREAAAVVSFRESDNDSIIKTFNNCKEAILDEYKSLEENLSITIEAADKGKVLTESDSRDLVYCLLGIYNGVYRMSPDIDGLVETSNNLARVTLENGELQIACLTRSSVKSSKTDLSSSIVAVMKLAKMETKLSGNYPGWQPNASSAMLDITKAKYTELFDHQPRVVACHAGLECGLLGERYPGLDMISFGPNIRRAHSPDEYVEITSVQKFWKLLLEVLKEIPKT